MSAGSAQRSIGAVDDFRIERQATRAQRVMLAIALIVCVLFVATSGYALDPNKRITQYMHTSWRIQDGSAPGGMASAAQTSDGFLWFASAPGDVYRFDGVRFLPAQGGWINRVYSVFGDRAGGLWVEGNRDIVHLKGTTVASRYELSGILGFQNISEDPDASLWVVRGGSTATEPLCNVTDRAVKCFGKADGLPISPIGSILADGKGGFWLGGETSLVHWHGGTSKTYSIEALKSNAGQYGISSLALGPDGTLWVGMIVEGPGKGLARLIGEAIKPFVIPGFDGSKLAVMAMLVDRDSNLWVATMGKGIFRIHGNNVDHYGRNEGLSGDSVSSLFEDREGIVWVTTTNGIDSFRDPRAVTFSAVEGLGKDEVAGVLASRDGTIWVANSGSLDHIEKDGTVSSIRSGAGLPGSQVSAMFEDRAGNLWVGVDDGLYLFKSGRFRRLPEPDHKPLGFVESITEDVDGNIWAECSSDSHKLVRIRDFQVREIFPASQVPPGFPIAADPHGGIWIKTAKGDIVLFRNGVLETSFPLNPGGDPSGRQILAQADGSVLAASDNGLVGWRQGKVQRMSSKNGLPCDSVVSFVQDKEKRWWLYTRCGIVELPDSELQRWWATPDTVVQIRVDDVLDGVQPGKPPFNPAAYSPDGRVWFANGLVVQMVDPNRLSQKALPALTYIESITVDRKRFTATDNLKLGPRPRDVQIDYTSPTFLIPQKVKFRYRLDPYDRDWHDAGTRRQAFYTDLRPGEYSFRVMASNSDGVWNESAAKLDFSITPAFYQTNWFRLLCAAAFLALLWAAHQVRVRQLHHQFEMTLDARVGERTRIARDLHDTLLQSAHGLLLRFQVVSFLLPDRPKEAKEKLDGAIEYTAEFITEARDQVQGLRISTIQGNDLAQAFRTLGEELAINTADHTPSFHIAVEGESQELHPILRDEIYKIAAEAMRNAFQHAQAQRVEVEICYDSAEFRLSVRDNGKGIDPAILSRHGTEGHYGLPGMRERAKVIGGKLTVWSAPRAGTEVELRVAASAAYAIERRSWFARKFARNAKA